MRKTRSFDLKIDRLTRVTKTIAKQLSEKTACAGFIGNGEFKDSGLNIAQLAAVLHYGAMRPGKDGKINYLPPRPFMDKAVLPKYEREIRDILKRGIEDLFKNSRVRNDKGEENYNSARNVKTIINPMLRKVAKKMEENIKAAMQNETYTKLSKEYAKAWGKTKFLDKSEDFINAVQSWLAEAQ